MTKAFSWKKRIQDQFDLASLPFDLAGFEGHYLHVPFCRRLCPYCNFVKTRLQSPRIRQSYVHSVKEQIQLFLPFWNKKKKKTLYWGGGTPSLLKIEEIESILAVFPAPFEEISFEYNPQPSSHTQEIRSYLKGLKRLGFQRLSLGAQSLNGKILKHLGREHEPLDVEKTVQIALELDFHVQVDLLYGVKGFHRNFLEECEQLWKWGVSGLSLYALTLETFTPWEGKTHFASDDLAVDEFESFLEWVTQTSWFPYELTHWSQKPPLHNFLYWLGLPYWGYGSGAHGYWQGEGFHEAGRRYWVGASEEERKVSEMGDDLIQGQSFLPASFQIHWEPLRQKQDLFLEKVLTLSRTALGVPSSFFQTDQADFQKLLEQEIFFQIGDRLVINPLHWMKLHHWIGKLLSFEKK